MMSLGHGMQRNIRKASFPRLRAMREEQLGWDVTDIVAKLPGRKASCVTRPVVAVRLRDILAKSGPAAANRARSTFIATIFAAGVSLTTLSSAQAITVTAASLAEAAKETSSVVEAQGGCGRGTMMTPRGCQAISYGYKSKSKKRRRSSCLCSSIEWSQRGRRAARQRGR
jgi:hypothetical protein